MRNCGACGAEIEDDAQFCPCCGAEVDPEMTQPLRDYWAELLQNESTEETDPEDAPEELAFQPEPEEEDPRVPQESGDEDWLEEVAEEDLEPLNEAPPRKTSVPAGEEQITVKPRKAGLPEIILGITAVLALIVVIAGLYWKYRKRVTPIPGSGMYYGVTVTQGDRTTPIEEDWVELYPDGTVTMELDGTLEEGRWKLERKSFQANLNYTAYSGTLEKGILRFDDGEKEFVFALPGKLPDPKPTEPVHRWELQESPCYGRLWAGDYYGTMVMTQCRGAWEAYEHTAVDVCGRIRAEENDTGLLMLWSGGNQKGEYFCTADVVFQEGATDRGRLYVQWGKFHNMELGPGEWVVDPGKSPVSAFPGMLFVRGVFTDGQEPRDSFSYEIFLRPWGDGWEDVAQRMPEELPRPGMLPPGYESWYLPLIEANLRMPEKF